MSVIVTERVLSPTLKLAESASISRAWLDVAVVDPSEVVFSEYVSLRIVSTSAISTISVADVPYVTLATSDLSSAAATIRKNSSPTTASSSLTMLTALAIAVVGLVASYKITTDVAAEVVADACSPLSFITTVSRLNPSVKDIGLVDGTDQVLSFAPTTCEPATWATFGASCVESSM